MDIGTGIAIASAVVPIVAILNRLIPPHGTPVSERFSSELCKQIHENIEEQIDDIKKDIDQIEESIKKICRCTH